MKKYSVILLTILLFTASLMLTYQHGAIPTQFGVNTAGSLASATQPFVAITGPTAFFANGFVNVFNALLVLVGGSALYAIVLLGLLVELVLLYPSISIQIKQKKIHVFHKKLVDKFQSGELGLSKTKQELDKLYDVNEKIHSRGALLVVAQIIVLFSVIWGLNLLSKASYLISGKWDLFNASLLANPENFAIPLTASLVYFLHAITKIYYKEREDYISPSQTMVAITIAVLVSVLVYLFSGMFAVALSVYFVTLVAFATLRYIIVEQHAKAWGKFAQVELKRELRKAKPPKDRFEYLSRKWNHLPVVRFINFNLLEEAISMTLGLVLALNFFGVIQENKTQLSFVPQDAIAATSPTGEQGCDTPQTVNVLNETSDPTAWADADYYWIFGPTVVDSNEIEYLTVSKTLDAAPESVCIPGGGGSAFSADHQAIQMKDNAGSPLCSSTVDTPTGLTLYQCGYRITQIPDVSPSCPNLPLVAGETISLAPTGGSGSYTFDDPTLTGSTIDASGNYTAGSTANGTETIVLSDANNTQNTATCQFQVDPAPTACKADFRVKTYLGEVLKEGAGDLNLDIYNKTIYRLYIENTVVPNVFDFTLNDASSIITDIRKGTNYVEFTLDGSNTSGTADLNINDPGVQSAATPCEFNVSLNLAGEGITAITPTYVNVGL